MHITCSSTPISMPCASSSLYSFIEHADNICYIDLRAPQELLLTFYVQTDVRTAIFASSSEIVLL